MYFIYKEHFNYYYLFILRCDYLILILFYKLKAKHTLVSASVQAAEKQIS